MLFAHTKLIYHILCQERSIYFKISVLCIYFKISVLFGGISRGTNVAAALKLAEKLGDGQTFVKF